MISIKTPRGQTVSGTASEIVAKLGNADWGGSYFTFSTENNETIWTFLKKCFARGKIYRGYDVMPWCGRCGVGISEQEMKEGYKLVEHRACALRRG